MSTEACFPPGKAGRAETLRRMVGEDRGYHLKKKKREEENQALGPVPNWEEDQLASEALGEAPQTDSD